MKEIDRYSYNRFGSKGKRVGQAVTDILSKEQPSYTAGEILDEYSHKFVKELEQSIENGQKTFKDPFYVLVLSNKEMWAPNVIRNYFIPRQTSPLASELTAQYPHYVKTLYKVNSSSKSLTLLWSIPGKEDCKSIMKNKNLYSPELVSWIKELKSGKLDLVA